MTFPGFFGAPTGGGGGGGGAVQAARLDAVTYQRLGSSPVQFQVKSDGYVYANEVGTLTQRYQWLTGTLTNADYQVRATITGGSPGSFTTGTTGSWLTLSTTQTWERASTTNFDRNVIATFEIRMTGSPFTVLATASITLDCDMT